MTGSIQRAAEVSSSLADVKRRVVEATPAAGRGSTREARVVAVSKYKPASDILTCYEDGQLDFGENYVQELVEKAEALPSNIRWHFIGTLQSNKAKMLASIPNLYMIQTLNSTKAALALNKSIPQNRPDPLNVLIQINTSGEDSKSGLNPLFLIPHHNHSPNDREIQTSSDLFQLAKSVVLQCPKLRLQGLMTIGSLQRSLNASSSPSSVSSSEGLNADFETLKETRDVLEDLLKTELGEDAKDRWGVEGRLVVSMGMSSDFEAALKAGSDIVRVGTGIFGERPKKNEEL